MITAARAVRHRLEGGAYQKSFTLADVGLRGEALADEVILFCAKAGLTVVAPLPGNIFRIVAPLRDPGGTIG